MQAQAAKQWLASAAANTNIDSVSIEVGDFFHVAAPSSFDIGYDYTFLCALHPSMRADWAEAWACHLAQGGLLITMIYPVGKEELQGPPWPVTPELYQELLSQGAFLR